MSGGASQATAVDALRAAGIPLRADVAGVRLECAKVARIVLEREARRVGFVPSGPEVAVPPIVTELGACLAEQRGPVAIVDGQGTWPTAGALGRAGAPDGRRAASAAISGRLVLLTPRAKVVHAAQLGELLAEEGDRHAVFLVDLTGFHERGELLAACELMDALTLVARSGRTRLRDVARWVGELPAEKQLGVLLGGT